MTITPITNRTERPGADATFLGFTTMEYEDFTSIAWEVELTEPGKEPIRVACTMAPQEALRHAQQLLNLVHNEVGDLITRAYPPLD